MTLALYAIAEDRRPGPEELTVQHTPLRALAADGLAMFVSEHPSSAIRTDEAALWRYERIVEELMRRQPILPARYGTLLADEQAARTVLQERHEELAHALREVDDAVELAVRATWSEPRASADSPMSGREYMLGRLRAQRAAQDIAAGLEPLRALTRRSIIRVLPRPTTPVLAAYLVERAAVARFSDRFSALSAAAEGVLLSLTGPWPPYSFSERAVT